MTAIREQTTARELRSAEEIWFEINLTILQRLDGYADPTICMPLPTLLRSPDRTGCNWCITPLKTDVGIRATIVEAIEMVRTKFNLAVAQQP